VHEVGDYKFELKGCQRSSKKVICSAWLTQTNKDIQLDYRSGTGSTRLVDAAGTEYPSSSIQVSSTIISGEGSWTKVSLVKDIPLQLSAIFTDVPASVQYVALFELKLMEYDNYRRDLSGQLRNTQITESKGGNPPAIKKKK
jgi:hypothetical protein